MDETTIEGVQRCILFDSMKNCENDRIFKTYVNLVNILPRVQAISPKVLEGKFLNCTHG